MLCLHPGSAASLGCTTSPEVSILGLCLSSARHHDVALVSRSVAAWPGVNSYRLAWAEPGRLPVQAWLGAVSRDIGDRNYGRGVRGDGRDSDQPSHSAVHHHHPRVTGHYIDPE